MTTSRRDLLIVGGIVGAVYGLRAMPWNLVLDRGPKYFAIDSLPPFRTVQSGGQVSGETAAFIGLDAPNGDAEARRARAAAVKFDLCSALFGTAISQDVVPIAYFSEFRCPYCRALERDLDDIMATDPDTIRIIQHELPIFGPSSELAARASVAAARQGLQQPLRQRFMRTPFLADQRAVLAIGASVGLDTDKLVKDMNSPEVQAELDRTRALADVFGFIGTPGLVVGHTVILGALPTPLLRRIITDEHSMPQVAC